MDKAQLDAWNEQMIAEFHSNGGKIAQFKDAPVLLLHHKGAKTGKDRLNPLVYLDDAGRIIIFASKAGAPSHPDWYHNLKAHPDVEIEVGTGRFRVRAEELTGTDRDRLFKEQVEKMPQFGEYAKSAEGHREIPVLELKRV